LPLSFSWLWTSSAERPLPTTSKIPENPTRIRSSSSRRSLPAPLLVDGSSVRTERFRGGREGRARSTSVRKPEDVGIEFSVDAGAVIGGAEVCTVVPERDFEAVNERGDASDGDGAD
jgi:hypothetical protein